MPALSDDLRRTVPFLNGSQGAPSFLIDSLALDGPPQAKTLDQLSRSLDISAVAEILPAEIAVELVSGQLDACLDHVFGHRIWERFRTGQAADTLRAFMLETRHYLAAAASRMSAGVASSFADSEGVGLLAEHVVEEADHDRFFEDAIAALGYSRGSVRLSRPSPPTLEWIYLMRALGGTGPLVAAISSGLMESSATDRTTVRGWHQMLVERGLLPAAAAAAMLGHVDIDDELGHGANWRTFIAKEAPIPARDLAAALNGAAAVAEMLTRWFDHLETAGAWHLAGEGREDVGVDLTTRPDAAFDGIPVWPAPILDRITRGSETGGIAKTLAVAFHLPPADSDDDAVELVRELAAPADGASPDVQVRSWMRSIDGHRLWTALTESTDAGLLEGWLLENYFYLRSSPRHVSAAIFACPFADVRAEFLEHLSEESDHAEIIATRLRGRLPVELDRCRPLPTTLAFLGLLKELALTDWRAYAIALSFLQFSYTASDPRHRRFYQAVTASRPRALDLVSAMREHDKVDGELGHQAKLSQLLETLERHGPLTPESLARAALVPQLAWSFLDGIWDHYRHGRAALAQRLSWA